MAAGSFEELEVRKRGCRVAVEGFELLKDCRRFGLRDQMKRAALSVPSNIAEGSERPPKDFAKFLGSTLGSTAELRTQLDIADRVGVISTDARVRLCDELSQIARMSNALRATLSAQPPRHR